MTARHTPTAARRCFIDSRQCAYLVIHPHPQFQAAIDTRAIHSFPTPTALHSHAARRSGIVPCQYTLHAPTVHVCFACLGRASHSMLRSGQNGVGGRLDKLARIAGTRAVPKCCRFSAWTCLELAMQAYMSHGNLVAIQPSEVCILIWMKYLFMPPIVPPPTA